MSNLDARFAFRRDMVNAKLFGNDNTMNKIEYKKTDKRDLISLMEQNKVAELKELAKIWGLKGYSKLKKKELAEALKSFILESFENFMANMEMDVVQNIKSIELINCDSETWEFGAKLMIYLKDRGIIYLVNENGDDKVRIPEEISSAIEKFEIKNFEKRLDRNDKIVNVAGGILSYYGALTEDSMIENLNKILPFTEEREEIINALDEASKYSLKFEKENGCYYRIEAENPKKILENHERRENLAFAEVNYKEAYNTGKRNYIEFNKNQKRIMNYIIKNYNVDQEKAQTLIDSCMIYSNNDLAIEEQLSIAGMCINLDSPEKMHAIINLLKDLHNNTNQWAIKGHKPSDLAEKKTVTNINEAKNKVGRNEKCPCGSKKKYKKCCGA